MQLGRAAHPFAARAATLILSPAGRTMKIATAPRVHADGEPDPIGYTGCFKTSIS